MNNNNRTVSWILDGLKSMHLKTSQDDQAFYHLLTPYSEQIFGPTMPILFFGGYNSKILNDFPMLTIRDGLIPLVYLFANLNPNDLESTLIIPQDFWFIVPKNWINKVKLYDISSKHTFSEAHLPKKIIIFSSFNSHMSEEADFEEDLNNLAISLGGQSKFANIDVAAFFNCKHSGITGLLKEDQILPLAQKIFKKIKLDISFPTYENILSESSFQDVLYYEINSRKYIAETFSKHFVLSRGGGLLESNHLLSNKHEHFTTYKLSQYHDINIYDFTYSDKDFEIFEDPKYYNAHLKFFKFNSKLEVIGEWWDNWLKNYLISNFTKAQKKTFSELD